MPRSNGEGPVTPEQRQALVNDALKDFYTKHDSRSKHPDAPLIEQAQAVNQQVYNTARDVLKAAHQTGQRYDAQALGEMVLKLHLDALTTWSKDDILRVLCLLCTEAMMENLDRYANDL